MLAPLLARPAHQVPLVHLRVVSAPLLVRPAHQAPLVHRHVVLAPLLARPVHPDRRLVAFLVQAVSHHPRASLASQESLARAGTSVNKPSGLLMVHDYAQMRGLIL